MNDQPFFCIFKYLLIKKSTMNSQGGKNVLFYDTEKSHKSGVKKIIKSISCFIFLLIWFHINPQGPSQFKIKLGQRDYEKDYSQLWLLFGTFSSEK